MHWRNPRAELRSADPMANPYIAFALLIYAGIYGVKNKLNPPIPADVNLYTAPPELLSCFEKLPMSLEEAAVAAASSDFVREHLPQSVIDAYCQR